MIVLGIHELIKNKCYMLPIYDEIQFIEILDKGGRNKPWLVKVNVGNSFEDFVLKIFDEDPDQFYTASEVYGSILASEFDLPTPEIALFDVTRETIMSFPPDLQTLLEEKGAGIKFGNRYMKGSLQYNPSISKHKSIAKNRIEIDTLYGFDQLINNIDRNSNRPNVLVRDSEIMVIDHELAFKKLNSEAQSRVLEGMPINQNFQHHIFHSVLKASSNVSKQHYFETFQELLRLLDVTILDESFDQMVRLGVQTGNFAEIKSFLNFARGNSQQIVNCLKSTLV